MARFKGDEDFAIYLLQLRALEQTLAQKTTFIIDTSMPPFDLLRGMPQNTSTPIERSPSAGAQETESGGE